MKASLVAGLVALTFISACSSTGGRSTGLMGAMLGRLVNGAPEDAAPRGVEGFTAEGVAANPQDYMVVNVPSVGLSAPARLHTRHGARETWQAQTGATMAFENGVMVATRGLIDDLLTMSSAGVREAIAAGGGSYQRVIEGLDTQDQLTQSAVTCTIVSDGVETVDLGLRRADLEKYSENCANAAVSFQNAYWLDGRGQVIQSRQFVSVTVGYVYANKL